MDADTIIGFGKYADRKLKDVPAAYLLFLYTKKIAFGDLKEYIKKNLPALKAKKKKELQAQRFNTR